MVDAVDGALLEDSYEFASLATGDLIVEENVEESLSSLADAVDPVLEAPYRAVAVRQGPEWWTVSARRIQVVPLSLQGEQRGSSASDGRLDSDRRAAGRGRRGGQRARGARGELGDDFVVDATYLDGGLWEVTALATGT